MSTQDYVFGSFVFDMNRNLLLRQGSPVVVGQRGLALLRALLLSGGKAVSKADLMDAAWPHEHVEESNLTVQMASLRKTLGPAPGGKDWIATIQRVGYQFVDVDHPAAPTAPALVPRPPEVISIAVLPFASLGSEPEQAFLADGLAEDLITDLSRVSGLVVVARHSSFRFRAGESDSARAAAELGVRYIVSGSVRLMGGHVRITVQIVDAERNANIWANRFDRAMANVFQIQDEVVTQVVNAVRGTLRVGGVPQRYHSSSVEAYQLCVRSRHFLDVSLADNRRAYENFSKALAIDPEYPEPHWQLAATQLLWWCLWDGDKAVAQSTAMAFATRALALDRNDATAHETMGFVLMKHDRSIEARDHYLEALRLDPNHATTYAALCDLHLNWGDADKALDAIVQAIRLNPMPPGWFYDHLGRAQMLAGQTERAIATLQRVETHGSFSGCFLAAALALAHRHDEAASERSSFLARQPHWRISTWLENEFFLRPENRNFWRGAFRRAGLPE